MSNGGNDYDESHGKSIVDKIARQQQEEKRKKALLDEEVAEFKSVVNRLFSTPDGQYFAEKLIRYCEIFSFDNQLNPAKLVEDRGKRMVYLELLRPYLEKEVLNKLEK